MANAQISFTDPAVVGDEQKLQCRIVGDIDYQNAADLTTRMARELSGDHAGVEIDLTSCAYLDSTGSRFLFELQRKLSTRGQWVQLVTDPTSSCHQVLELMGWSGAWRTTAAG